MPLARRTLAMADVARASAAMFSAPLTPGSETAPGPRDFHEDRIPEVMVR